MNYRFLGIGIAGLFLSFSSHAKELELPSGPMPSLPRVFGEPTTKSPSGDATSLLSLGFPGSPAEARDLTAFKPKIVASGDMIQTKGIYPGRDYFYIADTGKDRTHKMPGRVWRYDPRSGELIKFFESDLLITPKWLFYFQGATATDDRVIVSDYGEEPVPRSPGTGVGAKVISIPVNSDGTAGSPATLFEGEPFRSPEGVTVIGKTVILSDWAAGKETSRPEVPADKYLAGQVFTFPLEGGAPTVLYADRKWVTLIGACQFRDREGNLYLRLIDIDGGRIDTEFPTFPRSGLVRYWAARVVSEEPLELGALEEINLTEDVPITIPLDGINSEATGVILTAEGKTRFDDDQGTKQFKVGDGPLQFVARSPIDEEDMSFDISILKSDGQAIEKKTFLVKKALAGSVVPFDNKHAGSGREKFIGSNAEAAVLSGSADGTSQALFLFPPKGGTPAVLWKGAPFSQPMGVQFAKDMTKVYVTDQDAGEGGKAVLFELPMPAPEAVEQMFSERYQ
ncbi:hypothetical protein [Mesorhizobium caraganae]|uniref:hypothetical protein n=1 Tax=Mesorhizobium caraganae TaxID=483206 RepID=UPI003ED12289